MCFFCSDVYVCSDNEFLEDLIAKPEDADEDERNEDRGAMNMKLQRDLGEREEEVYERMIGSTAACFDIYEQIARCGSRMPPLEMALFKVVLRVRLQGISVVTTKGGLS